MKTKALSIAVIMVSLIRGLRENNVSWGNEFISHSNEFSESINNQ
ncbi:hypothetical protein ACUNWD_09760 [Sunxiuqinia sp. A32]